MLPGTVSRYSLGRDWRVRAAWRDTAILLSLCEISPSLFPFYFFFPLSLFLVKISPSSGVILQHSIIFRKAKPRKIKASLFLGLPTV